jgi:hypothetical protein
VKRVKLVFGPLQSNYAIDINECTWEVNNERTNTRTNTMRSNHTNIILIGPALIPLLGFGANNKNLLATQP